MSLMTKLTLSLNDVHDDAHCLNVMSGASAAEYSARNTRKITSAMGNIFAISLNSGL